MKGSRRWSLPKPLKLVPTLALIRSLRSVRRATACASGFGRLDRRGTCQERTGTPAQAWILGVRTVLNSKKPDPVYGDAVKAAWSELQQRAQDGTVELTNDVWKAITNYETVAPRQQAPLLLKTHLDVWCQTNPQPPIQPDVASFLHGMDQQASADVSLIWRWDRTNDALRLVPPRQAEFLQVPIGAVRTWLTGMEPADFADVDRGNNTEFDEGATDIECWRWEGFDQDLTAIKNVRDIRPGDILLVHPERGRDPVWHLGSGGEPNGGRSWGSRPVGTRKARHVAS